MNPVHSLSQNAGSAATPSAPKEMPHNLGIEQALLGALLVDNNALENVVEFLHPEHFYNALHGRMYKAIKTLIERGQTANSLTLAALFEKDADVAHIGSSAYLEQLTDNVITVTNAAEYGQTVFDLYLRRQLVVVGENITQTAFTHDLENDAAAQIELAESQLFRLAETGDTGAGFIKLIDSVTEAIQTAERAFKSDTHVTGVTTGFRDLDKKTGGLHPSDLLILAGRPSMGKSALATNIAYLAAKRYSDTGGKEGAQVALFSLEMSSEQLATRILSDVTRLGSEKIRRGELREEDFHKFVEASHTISTIPLFINDNGGMSVSAVRSICRRLKRQSGLGLIVIDYLQLLSGSGKRNNDNRVQEISEISRNLKLLAKELNVPVIALSQLSRQVEQRDNKRPQLSDLRESGSIEQDADVVMFVYREQYYLEREEPVLSQNEKQETFETRYQRWKDRLAYVYNTAEVIIGKQRHGPVGTIELAFEGEFTRFSDLDRTHTEYQSHE